MYGLVDCNNFYTSCERAFQPRYEGKLVADYLNSVINKSLLKLACRVGPKKRGMKQARMSGRFTTDVREVIKIK